MAQSAQAWTFGKGQRSDMARGSEKKVGKGDDHVNMVQ